MLLCVRRARYGSFGGCCKSLILGCGGLVQIRACVDMSYATCRLEGRALEEALRAELTGGIRAYDGIRMKGADGQWAAPLGNLGKE